MILGWLIYVGLLKNIETLNNKLSLWLTTTKDEVQNKIKLNSNQLTKMSKEVNSDHIRYAAWTAFWFKNIVRRKKLAKGF